MVAFAGDLCCVLDNQERRGLNDVHGRIITLEAFLAYGQPDNEGFRAMTGFKSGFSRAAGHEGWPALITDTLHTLVNMIEGISASSLKEIATETGSRTVDQGPIMDIPENHLPFCSVDTLRLIVAAQANSDSPSEDHDLWKRLYHTYTSTLNEPLKNRLLPILGGIAVSDG